MVLVSMHNLVQKRTSCQILNQRCAREEEEEEKIPQMLIDMKMAINVSQPLRRKRVITSTSAENGRRLSA